LSDPVLAANAHAILDLFDAVRANLLAFECTSLAAIELPVRHHGALPVAILHVHAHGVAATMFDHRPGGVAVAALDLDVSIAAALSTAAIDSEHPLSTTMALETAHLLDAGIPASAVPLETAHCLDLGVAAATAVAFEAARLRRAAVSTAVTLTATANSRGLAAAVSAAMATAWLGTRRRGYCQRGNTCG
jgi:hypothetical protein